MSFFDCSQPENVHRQNSNKNVLFVSFFKNHIIFPLVCVLLHKRNSIDVQQKQNFKPFLVLRKIFIASLVLIDDKFVITSLILINGFSFRNLVFFLLGFLFHELLSFIEVLTPSIIGNKVVTIFLRENSRQILHIFL